MGYIQSSAIFNNSYIDEEDWKNQQEEEKELTKQKRIVTACVKYEEIHAWMREIELCSRMHAGAATNINKLNQELIDSVDKKK